MHWGIHQGVDYRDHSFARTLHWVGLAALAVYGFVALGPANAKSPTLSSATLAVFGDTLPAEALAVPTQAWIEFCKRLPDECRIDPSEPPVLNLSQDIWSITSEINERVNRMILPVSDQDHWGIADRWDYPDDGLGDCEDIQLLKRKLLIEAGIPRRSLRMTVVIDEQGEGHAVLMVRTHSGDFILDNKRDAVLTWQHTGYRYVKREGDDGSAWVWLEGQPAPILTATK